MNLNLRTALLRALALVGAPLSAFFSAFIQLYKLLLLRVRGMFNLNDGRWGRGSEGSAHNTDHNSNSNHNSDPNSGHHSGHSSGSGNDSQTGSNPGPNEGGGSQSQPPEPPTRPKPNPSGPPDLDELWKDFNKKIGKLFGNKGNLNSGGDSDSNGPN